MKNKRLVVILIVGVVAVGAAMAFMLGRRSTELAKLRDEARELIKACDLYKKNGDYLDKLVEACVPDAEAGSSTMVLGVSRDGYFTGLFMAMTAQMDKDGHPEMSKSIRGFAVGRGFTEVRAGK